MDIITHARFQMNRFRGFGAPGGRKWPSPIDLAHRPYNSVRTNVLHCEKTFIFKLSLTRAVVQEWSKGDDASQWGNGKFDRLPRPNPLTDHHQTLHTWLSPGYLPTCKIWSRSIKRFLLPAWAKLRIKHVYSASFLSGFFQRPNSPGPWTDFHA